MLTLGSPAFADDIGYRNELIVVDRVSRNGRARRPSARGCFRRTTFSFR
jgi:hypothetical protein